MIHDPWLETASGVRFDPYHPEPSDIRIGDIVDGLVQTGRFVGRRFYSTAEHSTVVREILFHWGSSVETQMLGLLHAASEAYLPGLRELSLLNRRGGPICEARIREAVAAKFGLRQGPAEILDEIAEASNLAFEALPDGQPRGLSTLPRWLEHRRFGLAPAAAKRYFLGTYHALEAQRV